MLKRFLIRLFSLLPPAAPEFIYTVLLRPPPLRWLTNMAIRRMLPERIQRGPATIVLNRSDPVVSGAIILDVYEKAETRFFLRECTEGMTFIDIGANIGYYTAIGIHQVGTRGKVIALEPDPECFTILKQTIAANPGGNVTCYQLAASDTEDIVRLYRSPDNRGDNRLYAYGRNIPFVEVKTCTVDKLLEPHLPFEQCLIKIDIQGAEPAAINGMERTIRTCGRLTIMTEFWPQGIRDYGHDPEAFLERLESLGLRLFRLNPDGSGVEPIADKKLLIKSNTGRHYTTLIAKNH